MYSPNLPWRVFTGLPHWNSPWSPPTASDHFRLFLLASFSWVHFLSHRLAIILVIRMRFSSPVLWIQSPGPGNTKRLFSLQGIWNRGNAIFFFFIDKLLPHAHFPLSPLFPSQHVVRTVKKNIQINLGVAWLVKFFLRCPGTILFDWQGIFISK